ncbi:hypothetical protein C0991_001489 [Blastosporella zonata]|nr:hypothetical protein C0991_001489 [Blastosporella zonata]
MAQTLQFSVDDTSPSISYQPLVDTFTPNLTAGWNPYFNGSALVTSIGDTGTGTTFHVTSRDNATISITWKGTGVRLLGFPQGNANYSITLDGTPKSPEGADHGTLAVFQDLPDDDHTISVTSTIPASGSQEIVYFDRAVVSFNVPSSASPDRQVINDHEILFQGQWGIQNESSSSFHQSLAKGDTAQTNFTDTLLFYATGLDPTIPHDVQIINEDGSDLSLKVGGFEAFATGLVSPPPIGRPTSGESAAHSKGTIAALVLAGILGFLIISGFIFYFLVIKPQRRRDRHARMSRRRRKGQEAGALGVLNIAPTLFSDDMEMGEGATLGHQKMSSGKSGFARWKREVEGGLGSIGLGISFRHSVSTGRRSRSSGRVSEPLSRKSSMFTPSSKRGQGKGKKKAKSKHLSESSWSNSFALELPVRPDSADSYKEKDVGPSRFFTDTLSHASGLHTLSYMSTPSSHPVQAPRPPSYSISGSNGHSNLHSLSELQFAPQSSSVSSVPSEFHGQHARVNDPVAGPPEEDISQGLQPFVASISPPSDPTHLAALGPRDRGSAQYSSDDAGSFLGSAATRLAIRGLSPRTSHFPEIQEVKERKDTPETDTPSEKPFAAQFEERRLSPPNSDTSFLNVVTPANPPIEIPPPELPELSGFLDVPPSSPFMVNFPGSPSQKSPETSHLGLIGERASEEGSAEQKPSETRNLRAIFRLTPPSYPPSGHARNSFLDLGASSRTSSRSQSTAPSDISSQNHVAEPEHPRWSSSISQMTGLSRNNSSDVSIPATSPTSRPTPDFPYPTSLPPSPHHPEGHVPSQSRRAVVVRAERQQMDLYPARALRLSAFGSPTDSVPMSVTERRLRHSGSTGNSGSAANSSQLPPHPPLPSMHPDASTSSP